MKPNSHILFLLILMLGCTTVFAQRSEMKKAQEFLANEEYYRALEYYIAAMEKGAQLNTKAQIEIARCYFGLKNVTEALGRYDELQDHLEGQDIVNFASCWHMEGGFDEAIKWYEIAQKKGANAIDMDKLIKACEWAKQNSDFNFDVVVNPAGSLVGDVSFGIQYFKDGVVYSAAKEGRSNEVDRSGKGYLNLAFAQIIDGELQEGNESFSKNLESDYHVGATAFTSDFSRIFYTKSVRIRGGESRVKIFSSLYNGSEWVNEKELSINSDDYDVAYPAVSPDNKYLYYTSTNKRDSYGGKDLYRAEIKPSGDVVNGINLGDEINTFGDEEWPFIDQNGDLYFASNGHVGFGGLDIFKAEKTPNGFGNVTNLRQPINTGKDDFGYVLDPNDPTRGFLSSNRFGNGSSDAIFTIAPRSEETENTDTPPVFGLDEIPVVDMQDEAPVEETPVVPAVDLSKFPSALTTKLTSTFNGVVIPGVTVVIRDANDGTIVASGESGADGRVSIVIPDEFKKDDQEFEIKFSKGDEFNSKRMIVNVMEIEDINNNGLTLTPIFKDDVLDDIGTMIIPYEGNEITKEGLAVLDELSTYLMQNPNIVVKLNGHTEAKGNRYNNLNVSQSIAEKAEQIMISKGINDDQMIPRGYGERYLKNKCQRGVYCTDSEHLINRRIEVVVWRINE